MDTHFDNSIKKLALIYQAYNVYAMPMMKKIVGSIDKLVNYFKGGGI